MIYGYLPLAARYSLFRYLELSRLHHAAAFVAELVDVNAAAEIREVYTHAFRHIGLLVHFSTHDGVEDLQRVSLFVIFLKIKTDDR